MNLSGHAYTKLEFILIIAILIITIAILFTHVSTKTSQQSLIVAEQDILMLENAVNLYKIDNGFFPSTEQGLNALVKKPSISPIPSHWKAGGYLAYVPNDPWGHPYHYVYPGKHGDFDIYSLGADNQPGGIGLNITIGNW